MAKKRRRSANVSRARASGKEKASAEAATPQAGRDSVGASSRTKVTDYGWVERLIEQDGAGILRMLWRLLGHEQDVMDAYQDCFCKLAISGRRRELADARAYAYRTAANVAIEMIRTRIRRSAHWPAIVAQGERAREGEPPEDGMEEDPWDSTTKLRQAVAKLPDHLRNVVVLRDLSGLPYDEIGRTLGIEPTTARVYRRHAVVKLAEILSEHTPA